MSTEVAVELALVRDPDPTAEGRRGARLRAVGDVLRLYRALEHVLASVSDGELARLSAASRAGECALGEWAGQIDTLRGMKRWLESGSCPPLPQVPVRVPSATSPAVPPAARAIAEPRALRLMWELIAFMAGFATSWLVT